jgi:hypothetical protein
MILRSWRTEPGQGWSLRKKAGGNPGLFYLVRQAWHEAPYGHCPIFCEGEKVSFRPLCRNLFKSETPAGVYPVLRHGARVTKKVSFQSYCHSGPRAGIWLKERLLYAQEWQPNRSDRQSVIPVLLSFRPPCRNLVKRETPVCTGVTTIRWSEHCLPGTGFPLCDQAEIGKIRSADFPFSWPCRIHSPGMEVIRLAHWIVRICDYKNMLNKRFCIKQGRSFDNLQGSIYIISNFRSISIEFDWNERRKKKF